MWSDRVGIGARRFEFALIVPRDLSDAFPNGEFRDYFRHEFLTTMTRETRANPDFLARTRDTARWAREQIKRQTGNDPVSSPTWPSLAVPFASNPQAYPSGLDYD